MTTWLHGTAARLSPGDVLVPGNDLGKANTDYAEHHLENGWVFITNDPETAKVYAHVSFKPGEGFGGNGTLTKDPHVYEIEPLGPVHPDPHEQLPGGYVRRPGTQFITPSARVIREVKIEPNRNARRKDAGLPVLPDIDPPRWEIVASHTAGANGGLPVTAALPAGLVIRTGGDGDRFEALLDGKVVGYLDLTFSDDEDVETGLPQIVAEHLFVEPAYRRQGIATALYDRLLEVFPPDSYTVAHTPRTRDGAAWARAQGLEDTGVQMRWVAGLNGDLPEGLTFVEVLDQDLFKQRKVRALVGSEVVGALTWWTDNGEIEAVVVVEPYRRRGIATALFKYVKGLEPRLHHTRMLTDDGEAWSQHVGGANGGLPEGLEILHEPDVQHRMDRVVARLHGQEVGWLAWVSVGPVEGWPLDERGHIAAVEVNPEYRRRGVATALFARARQIEPLLHHSDALSEDAEAWAPHTGGLNGDLPEGLTFQTSGSEYSGSVAALLDGQTVGRLRWASGDNGTEVGMVYVAEGYRRRGIATALWHEAKKVAPDLVHSQVQYPDGRAWAQHAAVLKTINYEGEVGNLDHITCTQQGTVPTAAVAHLLGARGEVPGEHRNKQGPVWEAFKADIAARGIQSPIFITVDPGEPPRISEGNHRRDAAVEAGLPEVPVEIRYFGHAERTSKFADNSALSVNRRGAMPPGGHLAHRVVALPGDPSHGPWRNGLSPEDQALLDTWERSPKDLYGPDHRRFRKILQTAPTTTQPLYRGVDVYDPNIGIVLDVNHPKYPKVGQSITIKRPASASLNPAVAHGFGYTLYVIEGDRAPLLQNSLEEAIVLPGTFTVTKVEDMGKVDTRANIDGRTVYQSRAIYVHLRRMSTATARKWTWPGGGSGGEGVAAETHESLRRLSRPSWRDRGHPGIEHQHEAVIAPDHSREGRRYLVFTYGEPIARVPRLAEAKAAVEDIYGPLEWTKIARDPEPREDRVHGPSTAFNDAPYYLAVDRLPRLAMRAASVTAGSVEQANRLWGAGIDALFPIDPWSSERDWKGDPVKPSQVMVPWPTNYGYNIGGGRTNLIWDQDQVNHAITHPQQFLTEIDPRTLTSRQNMVTSAGVQYYLGDTYRTTGQTWKDQHQAGNRYPVIYEKRDGRRLILSGNHRAAAALVSGQMLRGLLVKEGDSGHHAVAVPRRRAEHVPGPGGHLARAGGPDHPHGRQRGAQGLLDGRGGDHAAATGGAAHRDPAGGPVRQAAALTYREGPELDLWRPTSGMFGPGQPTLDPRVFDTQTEQMRPEVRDSVIAALDGYWTPLYGEWRGWAKVYLAGSGASYWWDSDADMDILIGVDLTRLRQVRPANKEVADEEILAHLNKGLIEDLRPQTAAMTFGPGQAPFQVTFFVNSGAYDIRVLHPYAAYDMTDETWVVKPPVLPANWGPDSIPEETWRRCEIAAREAEQVLSLPEPERSVAGAVLFTWVHEGRRAAYSAHGGGWLDPGNVIYQYLSLHPHHYLRRLYLCRHPEQATAAESLQATAATTTTVYRGVQVYVPAEETLEFFRRTATSGEWLLSGLMERRFAADFTGRSPVVEGDGIGVWWSTNRAVAEDYGGTTLAVANALGGPDYQFGLVLEAEVAAAEVNGEVHGFADQAPVVVREGGAVTITGIIASWPERKPRGNPGEMRERRALPVRRQVTAFKNWRGEDRDDITPNPDGTMTLYRTETKDAGFDFDHPATVGVHWTTWPWDYGYNVYPGDRVMWCCHAKPDAVLDVSDKFGESEVVLKPGSTVTLVGRTVRPGRQLIPKGLMGGETPMRATVRVQGTPILPESYRTPGHDPTPPANWPKTGAAEFQESEHPRASNGEFVRKGPNFSSRDEQDAFLREHFGPDITEQPTMKHPKSGWPLPIGKQYRVKSPESGEGPPLWQVRDFGKDLDDPKQGVVGNGTPQPDEPIQYVYRGMSKAEYEQAVKRGYFASDKRGVIADWEGTNAAVNWPTAAYYLATNSDSKDGGYLVQFKVHPDRKWFTIHSDDYLRTRERIPLDDVVKAVPLGNTGNALYPVEVGGKRSEVARP